MKGATLLLLFLSCLSCIAQNSLLVNDDADRLRWENNFSFDTTNDHPVCRGPNPGLSQGGADSLGHADNSKGIISPMLSLNGQIGLDPEGNQFASHAIGGLFLSKQFNAKLRFSAALFGGISDGLPLDQIAPATDEVYTGIGTYAEQNGRTGTLWNGLFALRYSPSEIFSFEVGKAKHFWGEGYRTLFLSDNASAYPYFKIQTKVWHINYSNLFAWQQGKLSIEDDGARFEDKFTASHMLSWRISPSTSLQLFETIIWQGQDSLLQRGFDLNYLNPMIFYRPVEFAAGSADNAIIGLGLSHRLYPSYVVYSQFVFDEFLLERFRARDGWWANKFGVQAGVKGFDVFGVEGLFAQAEFNVVRPFTFSHGSPLQNYAHLDESLTHPLGANFYEINLIANYEKENWELRNHLSYTLKGDDEEGRNLGGDIFRSYVNPYQIDGNFIGQGIRTEAIQNSIYLSRIIEGMSDTRISLAYHSRFDLGESNGIDHVFSLGIRSNFGDVYR